MMLRRTLARLTAITLLATLLGTVAMAASHTPAHADDVGAVEHCAACGWVRSSTTTLTPQVSHTPVLTFAFDVLVDLTGGPLDAEVSPHSGRGPPSHS
jgi:hypothetical protein